MKVYKINEIFYSLQGEGRWAGRAAIFIRFSGCNLKCPFCDTNFFTYTHMTLPRIIEECKKYTKCNFVVITGGEPTLQVENNFIDALHDEGYYVAMETNGTREVPSHVDWVTVSPKQAYVEGGKVWVTEADEVKVVYDGEHMPNDFGIVAKEYYVQPCDVGDKERNAEILAMTIDYISDNPRWRLSLQQQKIINVR